ncbi:hypothetical protein PSN13_04839 [Micromonospora saelicesensis]|uniref:Uncharacterized protein n=1 Tax=Micromonospora saelicesensis TaxID=285676 RepID=A0A328NHV9_9ACTN|nr:hypothetical protein [Micromonospora saelicesensis]RAO29641.1 hypothetical protein PSN13_04839 [Micromonospora saelicesensis]
MTTDESQARYVEGITRLLPAGEQVRAVAQVRAGGGLTPAPPPQPSTPPATGGPGFLGVLLNVLSPNITFGRADNAVDWLFFGVGGRGEPGSQASVLHHAVTVATKGSGLRTLVLAVTDQRLLLGATAPVGLLSSSAADERAQADIELLGSVPRTAVTARFGRYRLNWKRLRIDFADGSWLSFHVPLADSGRPPREVAAALSAG